MTEPPPPKIGCAATAGLLALTGFAAALTGFGGLLVFLGIADGFPLVGGLGVLLIVGVGGALFLVRWRSGPHARLGLGLQLTVFILGAILSAGWLINLAFIGNPLPPERVAIASLCEIWNAETNFRTNDADGNQVPDFWTGDIAGLYSIRNPDPRAGGQPLKLISWSIAAADRAPLAAGSAGGLIAALPRDLRAGVPKAGYFFQVMTEDAEGPLQGDTDQKHGPVHNVPNFAVCAFPAKPGRPTFIINAERKILQKNTQGQPVTRWPKDPGAEGWKPPD